MTDIDAARERRDHALIVLFAMRYAMGRQSAGVGIVRDYIARHLDGLTENEREAMATEIDTAERLMLDRIDEGGVMVTMPTAIGSPIVDAPGWLDLRDLLRGGSDA